MTKTHTSEVYWLPSAAKAPGSRVSHFVPVESLSLGLDELARHGIDWSIAGHCELTPDDPVSDSLLIYVLDRQYREVGLYQNNAIFIHQSPRPWPPKPIRLEIVAKNESSYINSSPSP